MAKEKAKQPPENGKFHVQFNLSGLVIFSMSLILATGLLSIALGHPLNRLGDKLFSFGGSTKSEQPPGNIAPWGEFSTYDMELERPEEYVAFEIAQNKNPSWIFDGMKPEQARELMLNCGLTAQQVERAFSPKFVSATATNTIIQPDDDLIFALSPEVRSKFYGELARMPANRYMTFPFCLPGNSINEVLSDTQVGQEIVTSVKSLVYRRGDALFFSDFEAVLRRIPSEERRLQLVKALSRQSAVLVRLHIRPTTDIDKLLGYWGRMPGVRLVNVRPLLQSLKRLQDGGSVGLGYLLPQFARERLYTYPLPSQEGDPAMDCHWSTMNFFNETPDNRFADPAYTVSYLKTHYYPVAKPTQYGDLIFLLNEQGNAVHSAVYLADDILFTKNGNNYMEPWMLMRMKNLTATYSAAGTPRMIVYRNKNS
jgi:hypothetical protein